MSKVIVGVVPECGHVVAIDTDTSPKARKAFAKCGFDIRTLPLSEGNAAFQQGVREHYGTCEKELPDVA